MKWPLFPDKLFSLVLHFFYNSRLSLDSNVFTEVSIEINSQGNFLSGKAFIKGK